MSTQVKSYVNIISSDQPRMILEAGFPVKLCHLSLLPSLILDSVLVQPCFRTAHCAFSRVAMLETSAAAGSVTSTTSTTTGTMTTTATAAAVTVKLRDSCHACASSKLRCSKEKPTCSRCAKRGKQCEYYATRRAGRKQASKLSANKSDVVPALPTPSSTLINLTSAKSATPTPHPHPETDAIQVFIDQYHHNYADSIPSPVVYAETPAMAEATPAPSDMNFDHCFNSPMDICMGGGPEGGSRPEDCLGSWAMNCSLDPTCLWIHLPEKPSSLLGDADSLQVSPNLEHQPSLSAQPSTVSWQQPQQQLQQQQPKLESDGSSCGCLIQTLSLLSQLFQTPTSSSCSSPPVSGQAAASNSGQASSRPISGSFADSEHAIESINEMLQCPCAQDGYLLALMSLIVFKALAWYENAARQSPETADFIGSNPLDSDGGPVHSSDHCRLAAQSVLGKLHRVQGLINIMSQRLKGSEPRTADVSSGSLLSRDRRETMGGTDTTLPFSAALLDQLEVDLRKRVRAVSSYVVDILRHS